MPITTAPGHAYAPPERLAPRAPARNSWWRLGAEGWRLAGYSALILFFELAFIRYTSGYVRVFSFYLNFVLMATFLGMGVGLLRAQSARALKWVAVPALLLLVGVVAVLQVVKIAVPADPNEFLWGVFKDPGEFLWGLVRERAGERVIPVMPVVAALFTLCALFFVPLGALMGAEFRKLPPLRAYAFDIAGSLAGILAFALLSALRQPPVVWFAVGLAVWLILCIDDRRFALAFGLAAVAALGLARWTGGGAPEFWSPYYRINVERAPDLYQVNVNGSMHQHVVDFAAARRDPTSYVAGIRRQYLRPYAYVGNVDTALVIGAGTGNDVALLLERGAKYIDAVEIDPVIADIGRAVHPQNPYADPRVHLHVDDARAFVRRSRQKYDVVVFGTLDSQTLLSGMSSVRLDNYVYTVESFRAARARLRESGSLILYHMSARPYIVAKIDQMLAEAFGEAPGVLVTSDADRGYLFNFTFVAGHAASALPAPPPAIAQALAARVELPHDGWPYLYLKMRTVPGHYLVALLAVLVISTVFVGGSSRGALRGGVDGTMFLMGTGFLLVETKSVTEMSLLFGSTWTVNLLVFSSILVMVLVANLLVLRRPPRRVAPYFAGLFATLAIAFAVPASSLLWLGVAGQWVLGGLLIALPVLFASLIFSTLLARRADATRALAYNLLGAITGGVLEYSSMALGIKALYVIAAGTYAGAYLLSRRAERGQTGLAAGKVAEAA